MSANATANRRLECGAASTQRIDSVATTTKPAAVTRPPTSLQNRHAKNTTEAPMP
ncbi:hypothetical protein [Eggerthella sinensis]|uniref:hypothetical protein n=1 Tax=Eggerthella sinensis TaxID=242230 RepID=UPI0022E23DEE|nr:hypothetical protein [Eggerthella sinensis]